MFGHCPSRSKDDRWPGYWCPSCYQQHRKHGHVGEYQYRRSYSHDEYLDTRIGEPDWLGCQHWTGSMKPTGYGHVQRRGLPAYAHRAVWERTHGKLKKGEQVLHRCDNRGCVALEHLFVGTNEQNHEDKWRKYELRRRLAQWARDQILDRPSELDPDLEEWVRGSTEEV